MKSKKKTLVTIISAATVLVILLAVGIGSYEASKPESMLKKSRRDFTSVRTEITVEDGGLKVYGYTETDKISDGNNVTREITEEKPGALFEPETRTDSTEETLDRNKFLDINTDKKLFEDFKKKGGDVSFKVDGKNIGKVLKNTDLEISGKADFRLCFKSRRLETLECGFVLKSGRSVKIKTVCRYEEGR